MNVEITGVHYDVQDEDKAYVEKKLNKLERYIPKHARKSVHAEAKLKHESSKKNDKFSAELVLHLPNETMTAAESSMNLHAAIDIAEAKIASQLRKYKQKATDHSSNRKGVLRHFRKLADRDFRGGQN